jgi:hypothetical protein
MIEQGIGKCSKGIFATNVGVNGLLTNIGICSVVDLDFGSLLILLEILWSHLLCCPLQIVVGVELHHKPWLEVTYNACVKK